MQYPRAAASHAPKSLYVSLWERRGYLSLQRILRSSRLPAWLLAACVGLAVSVPLFIYGVPYSVDAPHHYRMALGFHESIAGGDYFPSWLASTNNGYGDPSVRFYPPALYYLLSLGRSLTGDWYFASLLTFTLLSVLGGVGIFLWARTLTTDRYAAAAVLLYLLSPFHALELYQAGLYAQFAAASVLPFIFAFVERVISGGGRANVAWLGMSYGLLILFHAPMAVLGSMAVGIYASVRLAQSFRLREVFRLASGALLGAALSCFYWLPMLLELKWKSPSGVGQGDWFDYRNNFLFQSSPNEMANFVLPMLAAATLAMAAPAVVLIFRRRSKALAAATVALVTFLMATPLSKPVWDALPFLQETQFPWRWLTITSACTSVLVAVSLPELAGLWRTRWRPLALASSGLVIAALSFTALQLIKGATFQDRAALNQTVESLKGSTTNRDFLPAWAGKPRQMVTEVEPEAGGAGVSDWSAERKVFRAAPGRPTDVRLRAYYYPYWMATAAGRQLPTRPAEDGALVVSVPQDATVEVKFVEPLSSALAGAISVCGLLLVLWLSWGRPFNLLLNVGRWRVMPDGYARRLPTCEAPASPEKALGPPESFLNQPYGVYRTKSSRTEFPNEP